MSTKKMLREVSAIAVEMGYEIKEIVYGKHIKVFVIREGMGTPRHVTVSISASDQRALVNVRADLRRLARRVESDLNNDCVNFANCIEGDK